MRKTLHCSYFSQVSTYLDEMFMPDDCFILIKLDIDRIRLLKLEVNADSIAHRFVYLIYFVIFHNWNGSTFVLSCFLSSICTSKLRVKQSAITIFSETVITVKPTPSAKVSMYHSLQQLKEQLPNIVIKVIPQETKFWPLKCSNNQNFDNFSNNKLSKHWTRYLLDLILYLIAGIADD